MNVEHSGTFTHFNQRKAHHWPSLIHPPTHTSPGWVFTKLLLDTCQWVQANNYDIWGWIFKHGVASSLHIERHAQSRKPVTQLATVYLLCRSPFWSLSTSGNLCSLQATWSFSATRWVTQSWWPFIVNSTHGLNQLCTSLWVYNKFGHLSLRPRCPNSHIHLQLGV